MREKFERKIESKSSEQNITARSHTQNEFTPRVIDGPLPYEVKLCAPLTRKRDEYRISTLEDWEMLGAYVDKMRSRYGSAVSVRISSRVLMRAEWLLLQSSRGTREFRKRCNDPNFFCTLYETVIREYVMGDPGLEEYYEGNFVFINGALTPVCNFPAVGIRDIWAGAEALDCFESWRKLAESTNNLSHKAHFDPCARYASLVIYDRIY